MFFVLREKSFKDINKLYGDFKIKDCIYFKKDNVNIKSYIYKIEPIIMLNLSNERKNEIINKYIEFLREIDLKIKIFIINKQFNIKKYIEENIEKPKENNDILRNIYKVYIDNMEKKLTEEKMYNTEYYIVISVEENKNLDFENSIYKLDDIGCKVKKVTNEDELRKFVYECINKKYI